MNAKIKKQPTGKECYWCGKKPYTIEHVPPKNMFPKDGGKLLVVPACEKHNNAFHDLDERMKYILLMLNPNKEVVKKETKKITSRKESATFVASIINNLYNSKTVETNNGPLIEVKSLKPGDWKKFIEKITRGLLYYTLEKRSTGKKFLFYSDSFGIKEPNDFKEYAEIFKDIAVNTDIWQDGLVPYEKYFKYRWHFEVNMFFIKMTFYEKLDVYAMIQVL